jgi:hypothetical protein
MRMQTMNSVSRRDGGTEPLTAIGNHLFRVGEKLSSPAVVEFSEWVGEVPRFLWFDGVQFRRIG